MLQKHECGERTMALLSLIFNKLNIPLSPKKTIGPVCELEYLKTTFLDRSQQSL
jgi:hypothetical protein